ncbi:hypothetical protein FQS90_02950 [Enterococcus casseliflavus]|uniref:replication initiator protein A n=1 Tax=Enterococcus sp. 8E11_MSG4843 TaxID=1834190 RepID=UPI000B3EB28A|nr:hypothetical protein [Enterococcus casseliflavus]MBO1144186.1 hypothetical protein [Enterococcus casseliflavus]OUZ34516.1 hypothetical protein A5885_002247 [Enterococcus sp. 8E11_MSG4843]
MSQILNISIYQQGNFSRLPKVLIQGEKYKNLSSDAKVLYAISRCRCYRLHTPINHIYQNEEGRCFF